MNLVKFGRLKILPINILFSRNQDELLIYFLSLGRTTRAITSSGLDGKFPLREGPHLSELPGSFEALLVGRQSLAHGTRLLHAKVKGLVLLVLKHEWVT